jgi:hypothetical protein
MIVSKSKAARAGGAKQRKPTTEESSPVVKESLTPEPVIQPGTASKTPVIEKQPTIVQSNPQLTAILEQMTALMSDKEVKPFRLRVHRDKNKLAEYYDVIPLEVVHTKH